MKKLSKVIAVALFALAPFVLGGASAQAQQATCEVGYTGPDSQNMCTSTTNYQCSVTNTNTVTISNGNTQVVTSGNVTNSGNGQTGSSTSGTVTNSNGTTFSVTITNGIPQDPTSGTCVATVVIPAVVPVTPETPVTPVVQPTQGGGAAVLPKTSGGTTLTVLVVAASSLAVLALLGVGGIALYRHYKSL